MFCNIKFNLINRKELFDRKENETKCIATVNAQFIVLANQNRRFMNILNSNYTTFDGTIPLKKARKTIEYANAEKLAGSDMIYDFISFAKENNKRIFLLGGLETSNAESVNIIRDKYGVEVDGYSPNYEDYPFSEDFVNSSLTRIERFKPDILFVCFGAPKQEFFMEDNLDFLNRIGVEYIIGAGGTLEFLSGQIKRAPKWVQNAGLEGIYRLIKEFNSKRIKRIIQSFGFYKYINNNPDFEQ